MGQMMFKGASLIGRKRLGGWTMEKPDKIPFAIASHAVAKNQVLHPAADVNGVELNETQMRQRRGDTRRRGVKQQRSPVKAARIGGRQTEHFWHGRKITSRRYFRKFRISLIPPMGGSLLDLESNPRVSRKAARPVPENVTK